MVERMPTKISSFSSRQRKTKLPYRDWLTGEMLRLDRLDDLQGQEPRKVANGLLTYAKRNDIAAVALPVRDHDLPHSPFRFLEVWGDPSRTWSEGPTPELTRALRAAGWTPRRQGAS